MPRFTPFEVSTKTLIAQGNYTLNQMNASGNREGLDGLAAVGVNPGRAASDLANAVNTAATVESKQERAKIQYLREAREDRQAAREGYHWTLQLNARIGIFATINPELDYSELSQRFRIGRLHNARARGVIYHLRIVLPELERFVRESGLEEELGAFLRQGQAVLEKLAEERTESAEARSLREQLTREVRDAEERLSRALATIDAADQAAAMLAPDNHRWFTLDIIKAATARTEAARNMHMSSVSEELTDEQFDDEVLAESL